MPYTIQHRLNRVFVSVILLLSILVAASLPISDVSAQPPPPPIHVDPQLNSALAADETTGYTITFDEKPDLSPAFAMSWQDRGRFVVQQLQDTAARSQKRTISLLNARGARLHSFWAANMITVEQSNLVVVNTLKSYSEITGLYSQPKIMLFDDQMTAAVAPSMLPPTAEPNIEHIHAPRGLGSGLHRRWDCGGLD